MAYPHTTELIRKNSPLHRMNLMDKHNQVIARQYQDLFIEETIDNFINCLDQYDQIHYGEYAVCGDLSEFFRECSLDDYDRCPSHHYSYRFVPNVADKLALDIKDRQVVIMNQLGRFIIDDLSKIVMEYIELSNIIQILEQIGNVVWYF